MFFRKSGYFVKGMNLRNGTSNSEVNDKNTITKVDEVESVLL